MEARKGFVFYYDALAVVRRLPPEQQGHLLQALCAYSMACDREEWDPERILKQHPELAAETVMAFRFMSDTLRRDTQRWQATTARRQKAKEGSQTKTAADYRDPARAFLCATDKEAHAAELRRYLPKEPLSKKWEQEQPKPEEA